MPPSAAEFAVEDEALFEAFVSTALPADQFHHEQHLRVAWLFVQRHGMPAALGEFSEAIKRFAAAKGAHGLYHETITWAFLLIIGERQTGKANRLHERIGDIGAGTPGHVGNTAHGCA